MPSSKEKLDNLIREITALKAQLDSLLPMKAEDEARLWKKLRLEWNYNSNHIEGNTLTYPETELLLIFDQTPAESHTLRELEEMKAHDVAIQLIKEWAADPNRGLTETDIRTLNKVILGRPFYKEALTPDGQETRRLIAIGEYKKHPNSVRLANGEMFHYTAPEDVAREMGELIAWYREEGAGLHPVVIAALLHYRFVHIHPFDDGNGRISRLILNYHLLREGFPPIVIKSEDKQNYLFVLRQADVGDLDAFCVYIGEQVRWSLELGIKAAKGESVEEKGDWEKEALLLMRDNKIRKKNEETVDDVIINTRIKDSIIPLFLKLYEKTRILNEFFGTFSNEISIFYGSNNVFDTSIEGLDRALDEIKRTSKISTISLIFFELKWNRKVSDPIKNFSIQMETRWDNQIYNFSIVKLHEQQILLEKPLNAPLSESEIIHVVDIIGRDILNYLQEN